MCLWWNNHFLSFFPTFLLPIFSFSYFAVLFICLFQFSMCRMALWLYILFRKVSTCGLYDHLVSVLCSWPFLIWLYLGKDILSSTPALKKQPPSRYLTVSCSRAGLYACLFLSTICIWDILRKERTPYFRKDVFLSSFSLFIPYPYLTLSQSWPHAFISF